MLQRDIDQALLGEEEGGQAAGAGEVDLVQPVVRVPGAAICPIPNHS